MTNDPRDADAYTVTDPRALRAELLWIDMRPSRRLRKLYAELADLDARIEQVRRSNPIPEHAPSSAQAIRRELRPLTDRRDELISRIDRLQNF